MSLFLLKFALFISQMRAMAFLQVSLVSNQIVLVTYILDGGGENLFLDVKSDALVTIWENSKSSPQHTSVF